MTDTALARPLVSVVIPVFDGERTLVRAVESVLAQGHRPLEIVIVDDGSHDATPAIAMALSERHPDLVRVVRQDNAGPARARNRGIAEARGDLLAFLDADDVWLPGKLEQQLALVEADPSLDFVICAFKNVADDGFEMAAWAVRREGPDALPGFVFQAMLARRRAFATIGLLDESMRWAEDTDWFLRAHDLGLRFEKRDDILVHRHIHDRNLSGRVADSQRMLVRAVWMSHQRKKKLAAAAATISVVIPARNAERYLADAIASIEAQAYPVLEIVVVDDGSTDATAAVAQAASPRVVVVSQPGRGIGAARNAGVRAARGAWLAFLDADDLWTADKLARQVPALLAAPHAIVLGQVEEFTSPELDAAAAARLVVKPGRLPGYLAGAMLLARATFDAVGPFDEALAVGETVAWFAAARARAAGAGADTAGAELGREVVLERLVLRRRLHGANYTLQQREVRASDYVALAKQLLDRKRRGGA